MIEQTKKSTARQNKQTRYESHLEAGINIASGFLISFIVWTHVVGPLIAHNILSIDNALIITCIFTVTSYIRSYAWRRFFNAEIHKLIVRYIK